MTRRATLRLVVAVVWFGSYITAANADQPSLQGRWQAVEGWIDDEKMPAEAIERIALRVHDNQIELSSGGKVVGDIEFKVDDRAEPRAIDLTYSEPERLRGKTRRGIYRLDGNRWTVCFNIDAGRETRPTSFEPAAGSGCYVHVYEKQAVDEAGKDAKAIADAWWYRGESARGRESSSQRTGAGPESGDYFAYTGTIKNEGAYASAWEFYARKCGGDETFAAQARIVGKPTASGGYYTIFQRDDGGRAITTFARREADATVVVTLHDVEATDERTVLQLTVVVTRHASEDSPKP
jgi:uncharacterized protein (TIGR03067 family)